MKRWHVHDVVIRGGEVDHDELTDARAGAVVGAS